jgi:hypothetical protein
VGWLVDFSGPLEDALAEAWRLVTGEEGGSPRRPLESEALPGGICDLEGLPEADGPAMAAGREAIRACIDASCGAALDRALEIQARHAAEFLAGEAIRDGAVGAEYARTTRV